MPIVEMFVQQKFSFKNSRNESPWNFRYICLPLPLGNPSAVSPTNSTVLPSCVDFRAPPPSDAADARPTLPAARVAADVVVGGISVSPDIETPLEPRAELGA